MGFAPAYGHDAFLLEQHQCSPPRLNSARGAHRSFNFRDLRAHQLRQSIRLRLWLRAIISAILGMLIRPFVRFDRIPQLILQRERQTRKNKSALFRE